jgi:8-oxo-dGTP pyrophosphatase MutT (NUDIX family)
MSGLKLIPLRSVNVTVGQWSWPFVQQRRAEIDDHFAALRRNRPAVWNGDVLLLRDYVIRDAELTGRAFEADFASFMAWLEWGCPDASATNFFAMGALRGSDGGFLLGVMGPHTANAGRIYFPSGTPDPGDVVAGKVDMEGNLAREIVEETGLTLADYEPVDGWTAIVDGPVAALFKIIQAHEPAADLRWRILSYLESEQQPELYGIRVVRGEADLDPAMPDVVVAFLRAQWRP